MTEEKPPISKQLLHHIVSLTQLIVLDAGIELYPKHGGIVTQNVDTEGQIHTFFRILGLEPPSCLPEERTRVYLGFLSLHYPEADIFIRLARSLTILAMIAPCKDDSDEACAPILQEIARVAVELMHESELRKWISRLRVMSKEQIITETHHFVDGVYNMVNEGRMDITPFIPVIVEATRFIFNEVSKWIADIRQRAAQENAPPVGSTLPMTKEQFVAAESDPKSIASLLNQAAAQADITEIRNLLDQLKTRRALFLELESQEVTAAGAEAAKLRVQMQSVARDIIKTAERLESALSRVYRSR